MIDLSFSGSAGFQASPKARFNNWRCTLLEISPSRRTTLSLFGVARRCFGVGWRSYTDISYDIYIKSRI